MSTEPGERRRRREIERAGEHAAQQAAAQQGSGGFVPPTSAVQHDEVTTAPVLSRRELRERERARAAQEAAAAPPVDVPTRPMARPASPTARPAAQQTPALKPWMPSSKRPAAGGPKKAVPEPVTAKQGAPVPEVPTTAVPTTAVPTTAVRRSYSKEAGPVSGPVGVDAPEPPVVPEPPVSQQSRRSMRPQPGPSETTRTPVVNPPATTGTIRIVVPDATADDRPARTAESSTSGSSTPGRGFPPVAPRRSALSPLVTSADRGPAASRPSPPSATPPSATPPSAGGADFIWPSKPAPGSEQALQAPDRSSVDDDDVVAAPPDRAPARPARAGGAPLAPRWGHVPSGSFDAITRPPDDEEQPSVPVRSSVEATDASPARSAAYTWLQILALALLAFVLGFIVWLLIKGSAEPGATGASAPEPTTTSSGTSRSHLGDL